MRRLVLTAFALFSFSSFAVIIHIIGAGGGYAEMKALSAFSRMTVLVSPCSLDHTVCDLTEDEIAQLKKQIAAGALDGTDARLEFFTDLNSTDVYRFSGNDLSISSRALYDKNGVPLSFNQIVRVVFEGMLLRAHPASVDQVEVANLARKIFSSLKTVETELALPSLGAKVHGLQISTPRTTTAILGLEFQDLTVDLTPAIVDAISCPGRMRLLDLSHLYIESSILHGQVVWQCDGQTEQARMAMQMPSRLPEDPRLVPSMVRTRLSARQIREAADTDCEKRL